MYKFGNTGDIKDGNISPCNPVDTSLYPNKNLYSDHISVFPYNYFTLKIAMVMRSYSTI